MSYTSTTRNYSLQLGDSSVSAYFPSDIERTPETDALAVAVVNAYVDLMRALHADMTASVQYAEVSVTADSQPLT